MSINTDSEVDEELSSITSSNLTIGDQIQELSKRLHKINHDLQDQVRDSYGALLQQATSASRFDESINTLAADVNHIRATGHKLKSQVDTQFQALEHQTRILGRVHEVSHLLRSAGTLLTLTTKLRNTNSKDVLKQAEIHFELASLLEDPDLKSLDFIQSARAYAISSRQKIRNLTQMQLVNGLQERNEAQVVNALKIFTNFNTLETSLEHLITTFTSNLEQSLKECFAGTDISVLHSGAKSEHTSGGNLKTSSNVGSGSSASLRAPGKAPQLTTTQNFRAKFWKSLHWLIYDELYEYCEQIKLLKSAMDQINQFGYIEQNSDESSSVQSRFWQAVQNLLKKSFNECPSHVSQTLQEGLSKLLTSVRGLEQRLAGSFRFDDELFTAFEAGYLSKCGANMKACLAGVDLPNNETVDNFIRVAATELSAALIDNRLSSAVAAVFIACGQDLCTKLEGQIKLGADSKQVVDMPNIQQSQNTILANILFYYKDSVRRLVQQDLKVHFSKAVQSSAEQDILKSLDKADLLISTILQPLMESILSTINIIMLSIHREPGLNAEKISTSSPSMYMKELQEFIARVWHNHIDPFDDKQIVKACGYEVAQRCIDLFVHNLSIVRPLSTAGRQRLKHDCTYMEQQALKPICTHLSELGKSSRLLRAISFLIVQTAEELVQQPVGETALVSSYIVLFLLFGHAGSDMQSPHTTANWSNERLLEWLQGHTGEREKLELISGALQRYRDNVRRKNSTEFDTVYPLMVTYFEKALKAQTQGN